jgi:hypothetical protein
MVNTNGAKKTVYGRRVNPNGAASTAKDPSKLKQAFAGWKNKASGWGDKAASFIDPDNYGWSKQGGVKAFGKDVGKWGNMLSLGMQGVDAAQGIGDYMDTLNSNEDLMSKIQTSAAGNPLLSSYLTSDQLNLLGDIQLGNYNDEADAGDFFKGALSGLGNAIMPGVTGFLTGGIPGAIIGAGGTLINSGIDNLSSASGQNSAELQALYQALKDAELQYKSMKRPNFTGLGIQQQYQNMYA